MGRSDPFALVSPGSIVEAATALESVALRTPLLRTHWLEALGLGAEIRLKAESLQCSGSFKFRGAFTMIRRLPQAARRRGVVAPSSGNHGQAVALAARMFGTAAVIVMPTNAPRVKVEGVQRWGATVELAGTLSSERYARAEALAAEHRLVIVPPYEHLDVIAGQGTVGRELVEDWPELQAVLVPVGGGGQVSGVAAWIKHAKPDCVVVGVEPAGSDVVRRSRAAGRPVRMSSTHTIADGLRSERTGEIAFAHIQALVDEIVTVDDDAIVRTTARLLKDSKLVVEYSGATALAALLSGRWKPEGRRTAVVLSGGNLDSSVITQLLANR